MAEHGGTGRLFVVEEPHGERRPTRARWPIVTALVGLMCLVAVGAVILLGTSGADPGAGAAPSSAPSTAPSPSTTSTTTSTTLVIEHVTLDPDVREVATARPGLAEVAARSTAPPGWDARLTPVVVPAPVEEPPRSGQDVDRIALPSAEVAIAGRALTPDGWTFANPGRYTPAQPLVFSVVARQGSWIQVRLPVRPNGTTGWVQSNDVVLTTTTLRVEVSISDRRLDAPRRPGRRPVRADLGRPARQPDADGRASVTDLVPSVDPEGPYGPWRWRSTATPRRWTASPARAWRGPPTTWHRCWPSTARTVPTRSGVRRRTGARGCTTPTSSAWPRWSRRHTRRDLAVSSAAAGPWRIRRTSRR